MIKIINVAQGKITQVTRTYRTGICKYGNALISKAIFWDKQHIQIIDRCWGISFKHGLMGSWEQLRTFILSPVNSLNDRQRAVSNWKTHGKQQGNRADIFMQKHPLNFSQNSALKWEENFPNPVNLLIHQRMTLKHLRDIFTQLTVVLAMSLYNISTFTRKSIFGNLPRIL